MTKDSLQPRVLMIQGVLMIQETRGIARADPMRDPLSKSALARPRSLRGNQTEATFAHEGYAPASPMPSRSRHPKKVATPRAAAVSAVKMDHQTTAASGAIRAPTLSAK